MHVVATHDLRRFESGPVLQILGGPKVDTFTDYHLADCPTEHARLEFVIERDGHDAAFEFAERTILRNPELKIMFDITLKESTQSVLGKRDYETCSADTEGNT